MTTIPENSMLNILLVEDDEIDVMTVKRAFTKGHITNPLYVASDGIEALAMLRGEDGQPPVIPAERRLILLDLNMPRMNGLEFLQELRADKDKSIANIPVVVLTTSNEERDRFQAYNLHVAGYMLKPVTFSVFLELTIALNKYWTLCEMS